MGHDARVLLLALGAGLPATVAALVLVWSGDRTAKVQWTVTAVVLGVWLGLSLLAQAHVVRALNTISSLLAAMREGDFSVGGRRAGGADPLGITLLELNTLAALLRQYRLGTMEATTLLNEVMAQIDVAVLAFDSQHRLQLINRAGEVLLRRPIEQLLGHTAQDLVLSELLTGEVPRTVETVLGGVTGRWELRRTPFRRDGVPHILLVLSDVDRALRAEERLAFHRMARVLGHEINNSLAPIKSIAASLLDLTRTGPLPPDAHEDVKSGLAVIERRAEALGRFMDSYSRLARLPPPRLAPLDVGAWIRRVVGLERRLAVSVAAGPDITIQADGDQLDQLLINLVSNAVEAAAETRGDVRLGWQTRDGFLEVSVLDEGPGIAQTANLFIPFFTTKPNGSGIGLALSRQIAEAHRGQITLKNRDERRGCIARLRLPIDPAGASLTAQTDVR